MLSDKQVEEFQKLYKKHFGKDISKQEALESGIKLISLIKLIYKPMMQEDYNKLQKRRIETNG